MPKIVSFFMSARFRTFMPFKLYAAGGCVEAFFRHNLVVLVFVDTYTAMPFAEKKAVRI